MELELAWKWFDDMTVSLEAQSVAEDGSKELEEDRAKVDETYGLMTDLRATKQLTKSAEQYIDQMLQIKTSTVLREMNKYMSLGQVGSSLSDKLTARLGWLVGAFHQRNEAINSSICQAKLNNLEKQFGFFKEDCRAVVRRARAWAGDKVDEDPLSLRQVFRAAFTAEKIETVKERKKLTLQENLKDIERHINFLAKEAQSANKEAHSEKAQAPALRQDILFLGTPIPIEMPLRIRQSFDFFALITKNLPITRQELEDTENMIKRATVIWNGSNGAAWQYAKDHMHEFPEVRRYVWIRNQFLADYHICCWEEIKILSYFRSDDYPAGLYPQLEAIFLKDGQTIAEVKEQWSVNLKRCEKTFMSLDEIVATRDADRHKFEEALKNLVTPFSTNVPTPSTKP